MSWTRNNNGGSSTLVIEAPATVGSGRTDSAPEFCPAPPPPPPPPPPPASDGRAPASRALNTVEMPTGSRPRPPGSSTNGQDHTSYEPPAAIQNAMMTRDKKPFTYTPGMGGKLDLSQIRSPRMARRVAKNANDEGIEAPAVPRTNLTAEARPVSAGPGVYAQVAVPVFPTNQPVPPLRSTPVNIAPSASVRTPTSPDDPTVTPRPNSMPETPTSPQVTLAKAPTPWLQNRSKPREELPEWAKRTGNLGPSTPTRPTSGSQQPPSPPSSPPEQQSQARERVIPLRIEDRPSVFAAGNEIGRSTKQPQQSQPTTNRHRERWGGSNGARPSPETPPSSTSGTYIVPIMVKTGNAGGNEDDDEDGSKDGYSSGTRVIIQREPPSPRGQLRGEPAPVQSRSFRVLQKITDTDVPVDRTDGQQTRQLLLAENDKVLMNKVKEQVDGDGVYLHREEDPRYRGAAIPSRAFRYLLNMTDSADRSAATAATPNTIATATTTTTTSASPGASAATHVRQQSGDSQRFDQPRRTAAASEQQVPEPKKYTGSAIPSKSFRILQAMTSPENIESRVMRVSDIAADSGIGSQQQTNNGSIMEAEPPPQPPWYACPTEEKGREGFKIVGLRGGSDLTADIRTRNEPRWNRIDIATTRERTAAYDRSIPMNIFTPLLNGVAIPPSDDTSEEANEDDDEEEKKADEASEDSSSLTEDDASQTTDEDEDDSDSYVAYSTVPCPDNNGETPSDNGGDMVKDTRGRGGGASPNEIGSDGWKCESSSDESVVKCKFGSNFRLQSIGDAIWSSEREKSIDARDETSLGLPAAIETMTVLDPEVSADMREKEGLKVDGMDEEEEAEDDDEEDEDVELEDEKDEKVMKESDITTDSHRSPITRKINGYKRTQTHSRLFRLLSNPRDREQINGEETHNQTPSVKQINQRRSVDYSRIATKKVPAPLTAVKIDSSYPYEEIKHDVSERIMEGPLPDWRFGRRVKCPRIDDRKNVPGVTNGRWSDRSSGRALIGTGNNDGSDTQQCLLSQFSRDLLLSCEHSPIGKPRYHRAGAKRT